MAMYEERGPGSFSTGSNIPGETKGREDHVQPDQQVHVPAGRAQLPVPIIDLKAFQPAKRSLARVGRRSLVGAAILLALGTAGDFGYRWWTVGRFIESTDDAYGSAPNTPRAPKVAG